MKAPGVTFVVAANDRKTLNSNLLASPSLRQGDFQIVIQEGFFSAARAYNDALKKCEGEVLIFVHQDVFLPAGWLVDLNEALRILELQDPHWGVLGCWGVAGGDRKFGYLYTPGEGVIGAPLRYPVPVRVLDEVVLILRKSAQLRFSEQIPGFHFYGADICLNAAMQGMKSYAISAFCIHNSRQYFEYPKDFYISYRAMKRKWRSALPIQTSCIRIAHFDSDIWKRRVKRTIAALTGRSLERGSRVEDPVAILEQVRAQTVHGRCA
jgi:hypothetical protein